MYGTALNPYPDELVKKFGIKQTHPVRTNRVRPGQKIIEDPNLSANLSPGDIPQDNRIDSDSSNNTNKVLGKFPDSCWNLFVLFVWVSFL